MEICHAMKGRRSEKIQRDFDETFLCPCVDRERNAEDARRRSRVAGFTCQVIETKTGRLYHYDVKVSRTGTSLT